MEIRGAVIEKLNTLSEGQWALLAADHGIVAREINLRLSSLDGACFDGLCPSTSARFGYLALERIKDDGHDRSIARRFFRDYSGSDWRILRKAAQLEFSASNSESIDWGYILSLSKLIKLNDGQMYIAANFDSRFRVPDEVAIAVLGDCEAHAEPLVALCERSYGTSVAEAAPKVFETADSEMWFASAP